MLTDTDKHRQRWCLAVAGLGFPAAVRLSHHLIHHPLSRIVSSAEHGCGPSCAANSHPRADQSAGRASTISEGLSRERIFSVASPTPCSAGRLSANRWSGLQMLRSDRLLGNAVVHFASHYKYNTKMLAPESWPGQRSLDPEHGDGGLTIDCN